VETDDGVLVLRRIHVEYAINASPEHRDTIDRVHGVHAAHCPVARSLGGAIDVSTSWKPAGGA